MQIIFYIRLKIEGLRPKLLFDETHPEWKAQTCLMFRDHNVLQEGFCQAQILTNTVCLPDSSPNYIQDSLPELPEYVDDIVNRYINLIFFYLIFVIYTSWFVIFRIIYTSNIFDAHQDKLPKIKDPERPAWVFPRSYGLSNSRKMLAN